MLIIYPNANNLVILSEKFGIWDLRGQKFGIWDLRGKIIRDLGFEDPP